MGGSRDGEEITRLLSVDPYHTSQPERIENPRGRAPHHNIHHGNRHKNRVLKGGFLFPFIPVTNSNPV